MMNDRFKRVIVPIAAFLIISLTAGAQVAQIEKVDLEMMKKIRAEGMERSQVMNTLSWMTDVIGPRLTGSPQMKQANEWTKNKMAEWGLQNAHLESWGPFGRGWTVERFTIQMIEPQYAYLIAYPKAWTQGTKGVIVGEAVWPDIKTEADLEKYRGKLKGAIVLSSPAREVKAQFKPQGTRATDEELLKMANADSAGGMMGNRNYNMDRLKQVCEAQDLSKKRDEFFRSEGVAVIIEPSRPGAGDLGDGGTIFVQSGGSREKGAPEALPSLVMAAEHYNRLVRMAQKGVKPKLEINVAAKFLDADLMGYNTIAEIPGSDLKDEVVMLGGHLDSWHGGTGATDNAAGCAVAMEAVRILKTLGVQPRRTIRVALWSGEEQGLLGSRAYVSEHFGSRPQAQSRRQTDFCEAIKQGNFNPSAMMGMGGGGQLTLKPDQSKVSVYFNLDNGTGKVRGVYLQGNEAVRTIFRAWLAPFRDLGAETLTLQNTGGTDHLSFDAVGIPGFQFIQDEIEYDTRTHHTNMDVYDRIQADDMKQASVIMAAFVYNAAMRDQKLPRKPLPQGAQQAAR